MASRCLAQRSGPSSTSTNAAIWRRLPRIFVHDCSVARRLGLPAPAYAQQASHMAGRLQLIKEKGLSATFEELVGARMVKLLHVSQQRYEAMVNARSARETGVVGNLPSSGPGARARSKRLEPLCTGCSRAPRKTGNFRASASRPAHVSRSGVHLVLTGSSSFCSGRGSCSENSRSFA
jgi:hypothetical protein